MSRFGIFVWNNHIYCGTCVVQIFQKHQTYFFANGTEFLVGSNYYFCDGSVMKQNVHSDATLRASLRFLRGSSQTSATCARSRKVLLWENKILWFPPESVDICENVKISLYVWETRKYDTCSKCNCKLRLCNFQHTSNLKSVNDVVETQFLFPILHFEALRGRSGKSRHGLR